MIEGATAACGAGGEVAEAEAACMMVLVVGVLVRASVLPELACCCP